MQIRFDADISECLEQLEGLSPRQFMIAWSTAVKQYVQQQARNKIGGDFGDNIARNSILTDDTDSERHEIYPGGENGYIAEHIHTGGTVRPKSRKYLAIPIDKSVKGIYPREYNGDLTLIRKKEDGPRGRAYLAKVMKKKVKPLWVLKREVRHSPRPWWPDEAEVQKISERFFKENF